MDHLLKNKQQISLFIGNLKCVDSVVEFSISKKIVLLKIGKYSFPFFWYFEDFVNSKIIILGYGKYL